MLIRATTVLLFFTCITGFSAAHDDESGRSTSESIAKLIIECRQALVDRGFLNRVHEIRNDGSFFIPGTAGGGYILSKVDKKYGIFTISTGSLDINTSAKVEVPGGGTLMVEKSPFNSTQPVVRKVCADEKLPAVVTNLIPQKMVDPGREKSAMAGVLRDLLNAALAIPVGGAEGPVPEFYKNHKKAILEAVDVCKKAEGVLEEAPGITKFIEDSVSKLK